MLRRGLLVLLTILIAFGFFAIGRAAPIHQGAQQGITQALVFPIVVTVLRSANVRAGPGTGYAIISGAKAGQRLSAIGRNTDCSWYQLANNCWIAAFLVKPEQPLVPVILTPVATAVGGIPLPTIVVSIPITTTPGGGIQTTQCPQTNSPTTTYAGPGESYGIVDMRPAGQCVAVIGRNTAGDWYQLSHGMWIHAEALIYADPLETIPITDQIFTPTPFIPPTPPPPAVTGLPPTPQPPVTVSPASPGQGCDPNYVGACVPISSGDLNCSDIPATNFGSIGSDPHDLDGNKDGIACEE